MHTLTRNFFSKERKEDEKQVQVHEDLIIIERVKTTLCVGRGDWGIKKTSSKSRNG